MIVISSADPFIEDKLEAISAMDPSAEGGIEALHVDQLPVRPGERVPNLLGAGFEEVHAVQGGLCVHIVDAQVARDWRLTARSRENCVRLRVPFVGRARYDARVASVSDVESSCTFLVQPSGASLTGVYRDGTSYRNCALNLSQSFLLDRLGLQWNELPRPLASGWRGGEVALGRFGLDRGALGAASRLFALQSQGGWRRVEVEALALGLLRQVMQGWTEIEAGPRIRLRPQERERLEQLRAAAEAQSPRPISMEEAVALSGLNKNKVHAGFVRLYGMSLHDYCQDLRMQRARRLLVETSLPVLVVAERSGFSEPTNFTAAFRKHFALPPSDLRRVASRPDAAAAEQVAR